MFIFVVASIAYEPMCLVLVCNVAISVHSSLTIISLMKREIVYFNHFLAVMSVSHP